MTIRLAIIDDAEVVVRGLAEMLRPHAGEVEVRHVDSRQLLEDLTPQVDGEIDIALVDITLPGRSGAATLERLAAHPRVRRVAVYTWDLTPSRAEEALQQGAAAYLTKTTSAHDLVAALKRVHTGERVSDVPVVASAHVNGTGGAPGTDADHEADGRPTWPGRAEGLTAREAEVIALITQGLSNQEIADHASLSINSVKSYIRTSYRKMGVTSRTNAVLWGLDHGFSPERRGLQSDQDAVDS